MAVAARHHSAPSVYGVFPSINDAHAAAAFVTPRRRLAATAATIGARAAHVRAAASAATVIEPPRLPRPSPLIRRYV